MKNKPWIIKFEQNHQSLEKFGSIHSSKMARYKDIHERARWNAFVVYLTLGIDVVEARGDADG